MTPREASDVEPRRCDRHAAQAAPPPTETAPVDFDAFFRRQLRPLTGLAYALSGSRFGAEDIAQEALLAASRRWDEVSRLESPSGWVRRVVANRSVSLVRRRMSEVRGHARLALRREVCVIPELPSESEHLWSLVRRLPRRQAQVVTLRALDRMSLQDIADVLGLSKESVHTHLRRARVTLTGQIDRGDS